MSITIILIAVAILATFFVLYRLVDRVLLIEDQPELVDTEEMLTELDDLARRRGMVLRELKDIELDYDTGKISDADFARLSKRYRADWLKLDRELDVVAGLEATYLAEVEEELEARLATESFKEGRQERVDRRVCGECGGANPTRLSRCRECGAPLNPTKTPSLKTAKAS